MCRLTPSSTPASPTISISRPARRRRSCASTSSTCSTRSTSCATAAASACSPRSTGRGAASMSASSRSCERRRAMNRNMTAGVQSSSRNSKRGCIMNRISVAAMALVVLSAPAVAADMLVPDKAPPPAVNWTGFYVGGDIAVASTNLNAQSNALPASVVPLGVEQISGGVGGAGDFAGGGFAGYNLQFASRFVAGIEADWTSMNNDGRLTSNWLDNTGVMVQNATTTLSSELQWA